MAKEYIEKEHLLEELRLYLNAILTLPLSKRMADLNCLVCGNVAEIIRRMPADLKEGQ